MPFPDPLDRTVRTITATCTRVSRESIIIEQPNTRDSFRRLSIRERATLQGFPITFQFYGASHGQKLRMVGNARSEEHTSELQSLMRISYAVFCLKQKHKKNNKH